MARGKQKTAKLWERRPGAKPNFTMLYHDQLDSPAFHDLSDKQVRLFLYCRREAHGRAMADYEAGKIDGFKYSGQSERLFYMNKSLLVDEHGLYTRKDMRGPRRDMAALVDHGFVDVVLNRADRHKPNVYALSTRWTKWGTDEFETPDSVKTSHMLNEEAKSKRAALIATEQQAETADLLPQSNKRGGGTYCSRATSEADEHIAPEQQAESTEEKKRVAPEQQDLLLQSNKQGPKNAPLIAPEQQETAKKGTPLIAPEQPHRIYTPSPTEKEGGESVLSEEEKRQIEELSKELVSRIDLDNETATQIVRNFVNSEGLEFARDRVRRMIEQRKGATDAA